MNASLPDDPRSLVETLEEDALLAGAAAAGSLRAVEVAAIVVIGLLAAVITAPYLIYHHFRHPDGARASLLKHRLRHAAR